MTVIYETTVTGLGSEVDAFLSVSIVMMFASHAPDEVMDYCIWHEGNHLRGTIAAGQRFMLGSEEYLITAVGGSVEKNVKAIGHITLKADGATEPEAPGTVSVERKPLVGVLPGDTIRILQ